MEPFLTLLEQEVKNENFVLGCVPSVRAHAESVSAVYRLKYEVVEERIVQLMKKFNGQQVPGKLFCLDEPITLPKLSTIGPQLSHDDIRADILAKNNSEEWIVEIKLSSPNSSQVHHVVDQLVAYREKINKPADNVKLWLVVMGTYRVFNRYFLQKHQILFSLEKDIAELEQLLA